MSYVGNQPATNFTSLAKQDLTGSSGGSVTLSHAVANALDIALYINNVRQEPTTSYTTNGTTLNFNGYTVSASDDIYVLFLSKAIQTVVPPDGSVGTAKIANSAVNLTSKVTGVLPVANGGTGVSSGFSYTEGTWTATLTGSTTNPSTPVTVVGTYTKIGNMCYAQAQFTNVNTTGAAGGVRVTGLPFTASGAQATGNVMTYVGMTLGTSSTNISPYVSGTQISFYQSTNQAGWGEIAHNAGTGTYISFSVFYKTT